MNKVKSPIKVLEDGLVLIINGPRMIITNWNEEYLNIFKSMCCNAENYLTSTDYSFSELELNIRMVDSIVSEKAKDIFIELVNAAPVLNKVIINIDFELNLNSEIQNPDKIKSLELKNCLLSTTGEVMCTASVFNNINHIAIKNPDNIDLPLLLSTFDNINSVKLFGKSCSAASVEIILDRYGKKLRDLYVQSNDLCAYDNIGKATELLSLTIDSFDIEELPPCLYELNILEVLDISRTQIAESTYRLAKRISSSFPSIVDVKMPIMDCKVN